MCQRDRYEPACDCPDCLPFGADGAAEDTIDAALGDATRRSGCRGEYRVRLTAGTVAIEWTSEDGAPPLRVERQALHAAAHALRRRGRDVELMPGMRALFVSA